MSWSSPLTVFLNFNVDGSARGKLRPAGIGGVLRDDKGMCWLSFLRTWISKSLARQR